MKNGRTYNDPVSRWARPSFAMLQKLCRSHRFYVWREALSSIDSVLAQEPSDIDSVLAQELSGIDSTLP